jgi:TolB-like protein
MVRDVTLAPCISALLFLGTLAAAPVDGDKRPSVALVSLAAKTGIAPATADLVTDALVQEIRSTAVFSRVVSTQDIQAALGMEQSRQMLECSTTSCMVEIGGALNVTYILAGSVGRLGESHLLNLSLVEARTGVSAASASSRTRGATEEALLDSIKPAVAELLKGMAPAGGTVSEATQGSGMRRRALLGSGAALLALTLPAGVAAAGLAVVSAFVVQGMFGLLVPITGIAFFLKVGAAGGSAGGAAVLVLAALALGAAGVGLLAAGWMP